LGISLHSSDRHTKRVCVHSPERYYYSSIVHGRKWRQDLNR
jgi:hypothetical protein